MINMDIYFILRSILLITLIKLIQERQKMNNKLLNKGLKNTLNQLYNICCDSLDDIVIDSCKDLNCEDQIKNNIEDEIKKLIYKRLEY